MNLRGIFLGISSLQAWNFNFMGALNPLILRYPLMFNGLLKFHLNLSSKVSSVCDKCAKGCQHWLGFIFQQ